jgi:hypothetical protein
MLSLTPYAASIKNGHLLPQHVAPIAGAAAVVPVIVSVVAGAVLLGDSDVEVNCHSAMPAAIWIALFTDVIIGNAG